MTETAIAAGFITTCAGVGGGWRRIINVDISAGDDCPSGWYQASNSSVVWSVTTFILARLPTSSLMEQVTRGCVVEQEDIRREYGKDSMHIML